MKVSLTEFAKHNTPQMADVWTDDEVLLMLHCTNTLPALVKATRELLKLLPIPPARDAKPFYKQAIENFEKALEAADNIELST